MNFQQASPTKLILLCLPCASSLEMISMVINLPFPFDRVIREAAMTKPLQNLFGATALHGGMVRWNISQGMLISWQYLD